MANSVVFSFWKKTLDSLAELLTSKEILYCRIDGSMPVRQRREVLSYFHDTTGAKVLLMTLGTGAIG